MILVSACLVGVNCKYNGKNNFNDKVVEYLKGKEYMIVCPEQLGGLTTPRIPAEINNDKVINKNLEDISVLFLRGAEETLKISKMVKAEIAILKDGSPSCGVNFIYDGTFTGSKIKGRGVTAKLLEIEGIRLLSEKDIE